MFRHFISNVKSLPGQEAKKKSIQTSSCKGHEGNCSVEIMSLVEQRSTLGGEGRPAPLHPPANLPPQPSPCTAPRCHREQTEHDGAQVLYRQRCWEGELSPPPSVPAGGGLWWLHVNMFLLKEQKDVSLENRLFLGKGAVVCDVRLCCPHILWFSRQQQIHWARGA